MFRCLSLHLYSLYGLDVFSIVFGRFIPWFANDIHEIARFRLYFGPSGVYFCVLVLQLRFIQVRQAGKEDRDRFYLEI